LKLSGGSLSIGGFTCFSGKAVCFRHVGILFCRKSGYDCDLEVL